MSNTFEHWKLVIIEGTEKGRSFPLVTNTPLVIGRGSDSDTKIRDPRLSRIHCELFQENGNLMLADRGSTSGTFLDGLPVTKPRVVRLGTIFQIGDTRLRLENGLSLDTATVLGSMPPENNTDDNFNAAVSQPMEELIGQIFYRYRLDKLVSQSKNSVVFRAYDTKRDRVVAVKILNPQMASTELQRERFIRAMRTMLPIDHPNIVRLRKAGRSGPYCWVAMQWVDGISLNELIEQIGISGTLDWKEAWRVAVHIGRALAAASVHHIVHRNITPSNILRRRDDRSYLMSDLIFARALEVTDAAQLTRPGDVIGDLAYMAPERLLDPIHIDQRSDMYALGATLYALLTGQPPFSGLTVGNILQSIRHTVPRLPSKSQIGIEPRFEDVVMKLLAKSPEQRFVSPNNLLQQLKIVGQYGGIDADWSQWGG